MMPDPRLEARRHAARNAAQEAANAEQAAEGAAFAEVANFDPQAARAATLAESNRRRAEHHAKQGAGPPENKAMPGPSANKTRTDYSMFTRAELRAMARARGLAVSGSKAQLAARLSG